MVMLPHTPTPGHRTRPHACHVPEQEPGTRASAPRLPWLSLPSFLPTAPSITTATPSPNRLHPARPNMNPLAIPAPAPALLTECLGKCGVYALASAHRDLAAAYLPLVPRLEDMSYRLASLVAWIFAQGEGSFRRLPLLTHFSMRKSSCEQFSWGGEASKGQRKEGSRASKRQKDRKGGALHQYNHTHKKKTSK